MNQNDLWNSGTEFTTPVFEWGACSPKHSGKQRDRTYAYASYLEKLRVGTDVDVT